MSPMTLFKSFLVLIAVLLPVSLPGVSGAQDKTSGSLRPGPYVFRILKYKPES